MVLGWLKGHDGLAEVSGHLRSMLTDARHSFDLAMSTVLAGADPTAVVDEVLATDQAINDAEQEVRRRLLVHAVVQGSGDIDTVLSYLMLSRKVERLGDQAKNILDLGVEGVNLSDAPDADALRATRDEVSASFETAVRLIREDHDEDAEAYKTRMGELTQELEAQLRELLHSDSPAHDAVPRALLYRYLKRIVANLGGVASTLSDPFDTIDYVDRDE